MPAAFTTTAFVWCVSSLMRQCTGVLVDYQGYSCIVAGKHVLSSPVAASTALVHFVLPGVQRIVTVSLIATRGYPCRKTAAAEMIHACK